MALIKCPECDKQISDKAESCPHCGYSLEKRPSSNHNNNKTNLNELKNKWNNTKAQPF